LIWYIVLQFHDSHTNFDKNKYQKFEQNKDLEVKKMDENTKSYPNVSLGGKKSNEKGEGDSGHMRYGQGNKGESKGRNK
jgi:hypothetical protein